MSRCILKSILYTTTVNSPVAGDFRLILCVGFVQPTAVSKNFVVLPADMQYGGCIGSNFLS